MDRAYRLSFCQQCTNRSFNAAKGIVCGLTDEQATFEKSCPDYQEDERASEQIRQQKEARAKDKMYEDTHGFSSVGITNGYVIGALISIGGLVWLILGWVIIHRIFIYPFFMVGYGIFHAIRTSTKHSEHKRKKKQNNDLLDNTTSW